MTLVRTQFGNASATTELWRSPDEPARTPSECQLCSRSLTDRRRRNATRELAAGSHLLVGDMKTAPHIMWGAVCAG